MTRRQSQFWTIYSTPILLVLVTSIGLLSGVLGDGVWDAVSWIGLSIPVAVIMRFVLYPREST
jgi:hypothetical protein